MSDTYLDLDGVLADFDKALRMRGIPSKGEGHFWVNPPETWTDEQRELDRRVREIMDSDNFWPSIPVMPGAFELITAAAARGNGRLFILTATPRDTEKREQSARQKTEWAVKNLHFPASRVITCLRSEKQNHATRQVQWIGYKSFLRRPNILIDDTPKNCEEWREAGGLAIQHVSVAQSIEELKKAYQWQE